MEGVGSNTVANGVGNAGNNSEESVGNYPVANGSEESVANYPVANGSEESVANYPVANGSEESVANYPVANGFEESVANYPVANGSEESVANNPVANESAGNSAESVGNNPLATDGQESTNLVGPISNSAASEHQQVNPVQSVNGEDNPVPNNQQNPSVYDLEGFQYGNELTGLSQQIGILIESGSSQVSVESSLDFTFAFNNALFSDRTLQLEIMPNSTMSRTDPTHSLADSALARSRKRRYGDQDSNVHEAVHTNDNQSSTDDSEIQVKNVRINTAILAAKSPFFYKLISNGISESNKQHVTLQIQQSEEAAFLDLLKFMYTNTLSSTTPATLLALLIAADKYEVASCKKYCLLSLLKSPMTFESAVLYLELPSTILMDNTVRVVTDAATEFLAVRFKDISKFQEEMLNLPLAAMEAVLSYNGLQVNSKDILHDFVMKWAQRHYTDESKRQEILNTRLLPLIRFQYMSSDKPKELLSFNS